MALVVVGGHSRSVGKTSVVAGLIAALRHFNWTAVKITQYGHGICSANGEACDCATADHSWAISEERDRSGESDTSRFLVAGAVQSLWVRTEQGRLGRGHAHPAPTTRRERERHPRVEQRAEVCASRSVPDSPRSLNRRLQELCPGVPGSGKRGNSARTWRWRCMAIRLSEASSRTSHFSHHPAALRYPRDSEVRQFQSPWKTPRKRKAGVKS